MDPLMVQQLAWHGFVLAFIWAPFAIGAMFVDGWNSENGRVWRAKLAHPVRGWRVAHA